MLSGIALIASAAWFAGAGQNAVTPLDRAHDAYLSRNYLALTSAIRDVFLDADSDAIVRANALALLSQANLDTGGDLPVDWTPPHGLTNLQFRMTRKQDPDRVSYKILLRGDLPALDTMSQIQLLRHPDEVILDKVGARGEWGVEQDEGGIFSFRLELPVATPLPDDLYLVRFVLKDGTHSEGWFILSDLQASSAPVVTAPSEGEALTSGQPEIVWTDYQSPEYKSYESRRLSLSVTKVLVDDRNGWKSMWALYTPARANTRTVVGVDPDGTGPVVLEPGRYWLSLEYGELRHFGPMNLRRGSRIGLNFFVRAERSEPQLVPTADHQ